jgi:hypothetical protein
MSKLKPEYSRMTNFSRRSVLKQMALVSVGIALVPSCMEDRSKASLLLKNLKISAADEAMLAELCEIIIPKTNTPGAKDISAHLFVLTMIDDCTPKEQQEVFLKGMEEFKNLCKSTAGKSLVDCNAAQKQKITDALLAIIEEDKPIKHFMGMVKGRTIQAYTSSEFFLTKVHVYELVPGRFHGCVPA